jgi:hypothetical protein
MMFRRCSTGSAGRLKATDTVRLPCAALVLLLCASAPTEPAEISPAIRSITISGNTRTRTDVIRRELLFAEGESLDTALVAETVRNLRGLLFLGDIALDTSTSGSDIDIVVRVRDLYARAVTPLLAGDREELSYGALAMDYNFLGRGQIIQLTLEHDAVTGNRGEVYYRAPRMGVSRWAVTSLATVGEEGHLAQMTFSRPYYALSAGWTAGGTGYSQDRVRRRYSNGALSDRYSDRLVGARVWYGRSFGHSTKVRPDIQLSLSDRRFSPEPGYTYAPKDRRRVLPSVGLLIWRPRYETARFVHQLGRLEDLQTGSWASARAGVSRNGLGSDADFLFGSLEFAPRFRPSPSTYVFATASVSARHQDGGYADLNARAELRSHSVIGNHHSVAFRILWEAIGRPEDNDQLLLGAFRGLRGYVPRRFDGSRRLLLNLEARPTLRRRPAYVLAGALFLDAGSAWTPDVSSRTISASSGAGLRLALPRLYASPIIRADLAYAFRDHAWQLWVGLGQYF